MFFSELRSIPSFSCPRDRRHTQNAPLLGQEPAGSKRRADGQGSLLEMKFEFQVPWKSFGLSQSHHYSWWGTLLTRQSWFQIWDQHKRDHCQPTRSKPSLCPSKLGLMTIPELWILLRPPLCQCWHISLPWNNIFQDSSWCLHSAKRWVYSESQVIADPDITTLASHMSSQSPQAVMLVRISEQMLEPTCDYQQAQSAACGAKRLRLCSCQEYI